VAGSCTAHRRLPEEAFPGPTFGVYRARIVDARTGDGRRARALVFAELPDRLHVEILSPVGATEAILDAGSGRVSITFPRDRVSYVGPADEQAFAALVGLRATPAAVVQSLLGTAPSDLEVERDGRPGRLPESLRIRTADGVLTLKLRTIEPVRGAGSTVGTGHVPPDVETRPVADLAAERPRDRGRDSR